MLRPPAADDALSLSEAINNIRIVENTARIPWPYSLDDARAFLRLVALNDSRSLGLAIVVKNKPAQIAGGIGYEAARSGHVAEIGYWLAEDVWGKGYGFEAAEAVTAHAFDISKHERMVAGYRHGNEASRRILDRLGFRVTHHTMTHSIGLGYATPTTRLELTRREWALRPKG